MDHKTIIRFRPREAPAPIYTTFESEAWYDTLLNSDRVMEILGTDQIQGSKTTTVSQ